MLQPQQVHLASSRIHIKSIRCVWCSQMMMPSHMLMCVHAKHCQNEVRGMPARVAAESPNKNMTANVVAAYGEEFMTKI